MAVGQAAPETGERAHEGPARPFWPEFWRGFRALLPLWIGVLPFGVTMAVLARPSGIGAPEMAAMSLIVYAGSGQLAIVRLLGEGAAPVAIVLTVFLLNLRHILYGLSLHRYFPPRPRPPRAFLAYVLTDEAYGLAIHDYRSGRGSVAFYTGAAMSLYVSWFGSTVGGAAISASVPDPERYGLEVVFPLCFLALLLPLIRLRTDVLVAIGSAATAIIVSRVADGGTTILFATIVGAAAGAWLTRGQQL